MAYGLDGRFLPGSPAPVRFAQYIEPDLMGGCWLWTGGLGSDGYGSFKLGRSIAAHRASWLMHRGEIPPRTLVCHRCDVRCCVNPDHLFLGTHHDNNMDRSAKGRNHDNRGERHGLARLSEGQAAEVLARCRAGEKQAAVGRDFGISQTAVCNIVTGRRWPHLQGRVN